MSKRTLLLTGTTDMYRDVFDPDHKDDTVESVFDVTLPSKQKYSKLHGYDIMCLRSFGVDNSIPSDDRFNNPTRDLGFIRVIRCLQMLNHYDIVFWIDADSLITKPSLSVDQILGGSDRVLTASHDWSTKSYVSAGNFILQRTENLQKFIDVFCSLGPHYPEEQSTFNAIFNNPELSSLINLLDHKFLNSVPTREMYGVSWDGRRDIISSWTNDSFLLHLTGVENRTRHDILKKYFGEFL
tara:strand:+ start:818 stop:1537 length:720 start_codon:yes stop_codon:yes gene_type:complete